MFAKVIAVGIALLFAAAVSASDVQDMEPSPEVINGLKGLVGEVGAEDVSDIINGFVVPNERMSYYTYLLMYDNSNRPVSSCGGSLIHDDIVLTAAHCLFDKSGKHWLRMVVFGNLKSHFHPSNPFNPSTGQWRDAVIRYAAPNYNPSLLHNDVALLKLAGPIGVPKPRLNNNGAIPSPGMTMFVVGYGNIKTPGPGATQLMGVDIINQAPDVCAAHLAPYYQEAIMLCGNKPGKGACYGDSGGPLFLPHSNHPSDDLQIGIVSFGLGGCADFTPTRSDGYARVSAFYGLITHFVCTASASPHTSPLCK